MSQSISSSTKAEEVVSVDVSQAKTLLQSGHQYLDVRWASDLFYHITMHVPAAAVVNEKSLHMAGLRTSLGEAIVRQLRSSTFPTCSTHLKVNQISITF